MKITYITPIFLPHIGGIEKVVNDMASYMITKNFEVTVITADQTINELVYDEGFPFKVIRIPVKSCSGILRVLRQKDKEVIRNELIDSNIIHSHDCKFLLNFLVANKKKYKYKLFLSSNGFIFHSKKNFIMKKFFFKCVVAKNSKYFDKVISISEQDDNIAKAYGINNSEVILPGVDVDKFVGVDIKDKGNSFVYWGRIAENKGLYECIEKLSQLKDFSFKIIGACSDPEYYNKLQRIIQENNVENKVVFLGMKNDSELKEYISESTFILFPSLHEGYGMTLAESLKSGKKIIANCNESYMKILHDCKAEDFLFDFVDKNTSISEKIDFLKKKEIIPVDIDQFSMQVMYKKIENIYNK